MQTELRMLVANISMRILIGMVQALVTPGICRAASSSKSGVAEEDVPRRESQMTVFNAEQLLVPTIRRVALA
ncbi:hypothetical protein [Methyloterricola oryzae]|uniref:hypothetical protein n=1 Tax=Methyloterricola oryzae TaxID=1495050 RepID=UPI0011AF8267|nr:hypothetical protein [Methyloterricola oryzae]